MQPERRIAHLDADAFYVSVELQRRPELRGLPVVVAGSGPRAVVTTASYEARAYGVHSATPASQARRLCPNAVFISPDFDAYRAVSGRIMALLREAIEMVEAVSLDEAYLDLTGLSHPRAEMRRLVARIERETGISCSVGIGPNKLVAKVASDAEKPRGFVSLSREEACARFADAPPRVLPGIGPKTATRLEALGIGSIAALQAAPHELLVSTFGARLGPYLHRRAAFEDDSPVEPVRVAVSRSSETTFPTDVSDPAALERSLRTLSSDLCSGLRRRGVRGRTVAIKVRLDDFTTVTRARTLPHATNETQVVADVACDLLHDYAPPRPVRLLGVRVAGFEHEESSAASATPQLSLRI
jgi:DNA polymerase-4